MKNCIFCNTAYTRMQGVKRFKKDYGYCSIECLVSDKPPCPNCGNRVTRGGKEKLGEYIGRSYCSAFCGQSHANSHERSEQVKKNMSEARTAFYKTEHGRAVARATGKKHSAFLKSKEGTQAKHAWHEGAKKWRETPDGKAKLKEFANAKRAPEFRSKISNAIKDFYASSRGDETRKRYSSLYTGKKRPVEVTQKMKQSLAKFWDSDKGLALAERLSSERGGDYTETPYGPGWRKQRERARERDSYTCQLCDTQDFSPYEKPDVHHIYPRRIFGYIPGENCNHTWANDIDNLVTLCASCHGKVERKVRNVPIRFQDKADAHFKRFMITQLPSDILISTAE